MGLDGISVNQLRVSQDNNSSQFNSQVNFSPENKNKIVDGLSEGQRVDPDKEKEHQNQQFDRSDFKDEEEEKKEYNPDVAVQEEVIKIDLSKTDKYGLRIDDDTQNISIIDKSSGDVIQKISAENLSKFVQNMSYVRGSIINRKF